MSKVFLSNYEYLFYSGTLFCCVILYSGFSLEGGRNFEKIDPGGVSAIRKSTKGARVIKGKPTQESICIMRSYSFWTLQ